MICRNCGGTNPSDYNFCAHCGAKLENASDATLDEARKSGVPPVGRDMEALSRRMDEMLFRLERIERALAISDTPPVVSSSFASQPLSRPSASQVPPIQSNPPPVAYPPAPQPSASVASSATPWEAIVGGKWTLWVGVTAVFLAMAFFLAYAWKYLGMEARFAIGLGFGFAFLGAGYWIHNRMEKAFGEVIAGTGLAIIYLTMWAGFNDFKILGFLPAFVMMFCVCAVGVALSLYFDTQNLSVLSTLGGFLTPILMNTGGGAPSSPFTFLLYVTLLLSGVLAISLFKNWRPLIAICFVATFLLLSGWWSSNSGAIHTYRWEVFAFISIDFAIFLAAACVGSILRREEMASDLIILIYSDAFFYTLFGHDVLVRSLLTYYYLTLGVIFAVLTWMAHRAVPGNRNLKYAMLILSVFYITITIPLQLNEGWMVSAWIIESALILDIGVRLNKPITRAIGYVIWELALFAMFYGLFEFDTDKMFLYVNARTFPVLIWALANGWLTYAMLRTPSKEGFQLSGLFSAAAVLGGALFVPLETGFVCHRVFQFDYQTGSFSIACISALILGLYAIGVFSIGMRANHLVTRVTSFAVTLLTYVYVTWACQMFPSDMLKPFLNLRILSFVVLSLAFVTMAVSYAHGGVNVEKNESDLSKSLGVIALVALLYGLTQELYLAFQYHAASLGDNWSIAAQMGISLMWTFYAIAVLVGGIIMAARSFRIAGLILLGVTALKAFLIDLSFVNMPYRILSFAGLGVGLIIISWLYGRYGIGKQTTET